MLKNFIFDKLIENLEFEPTPSQENLLKELSVFLSVPEDRKIFLIKGYAGTGKTTVVNAIVKTLSELKNKSVLLAPTGRAAKVLTGYTGRPAYTIHKHIYRQKSAKDGLGNFVLDRNIFNTTFFIVDESSMIGDKIADNNIFGSGDLLSDLTEYINNGINCHLILIGDTAQLPPVGLDISPALDRQVLEKYGFTVDEFFLTDIVRTALDSGILDNATRIREQINSRNISIPRIITSDFPDIIRITGNEILEELENCYNKFGTSETIVLSRTNKRANQFNTGIRNQILYREEEISIGDLLMVVKNNYFYNSKETNLDFIANGDIIRLEKIHGFQSFYGYRFADVTFSMIDYNNIEIKAKILIDTLSLDTASLGMVEQKALFNSILEEYDDTTNKHNRIQKVRENPYFNALQVKFAYAVTCHKAQGGQWKAVFIDIGYFKPEMLSVEYLRWLYTAFTRASERLYLVNFPEEFFVS